MTPALHAQHASTAGIYCSNPRNRSPKRLSEMDRVCQCGWFTYPFDLLSRARMAGDRCAMNPGEGEPAKAVSESAPADELPLASGESKDHWFHLASCGLPLRVGIGEIDCDRVNDCILERGQHAAHPGTEIARLSPLPH